MTLLDVAPGTYGVRVMFGATWTGRAFAQGATFFQREEPVSIVGPSESAEARAPLIVLEPRGSAARGRLPLRVTPGGARTQSTGDQNRLSGTDRPIS